MSELEKIIDGLKQDIAALAKTTVQEFAEEIVSDATSFAEKSTERLLRYARQYKAKEIDKDMLEDLVNGQIILGKMEFLLQQGLAKVRADRFTTGFKNLLIQTVIKIAGTIL